MQEKPRLSFWDIWNMSFGFLGIQFGFALQLANTSRIFQKFGGEVEDLAIYYIAGPITGLLVQPIIGYLSDRTWSPRWGRRRPFFMIGAILATAALCIMPNSPSLYFAIGMLWIMDTAFNISMEPFRAFVGDKLPSDQRTMGYSMQSFFIGIGAVIASCLPYLFTTWGVSNEAPEGVVPDSVKFSFYVGAVAILLAVGYTVFKTKEYPPEDMEAFKREKAATKGIANAFSDIFSGIFKMPTTMIQLAVVQFFSWFGLYCMWVFATPAVAENAFGTTDPNSAAYSDAGDWVGILFAVYNGVAFLVAFLLPVIANKTSRKTTHQISLILGGIGLLSMLFIKDQYWLMLSMVGIGFAWSSILSMPYAILIGSLPENKLGFFVGVFNFFIVIPQLIAGLVLGPIVEHVFDKQPIYTLVLGGISFFIAAASVFLVKDNDDIKFST